MNGNCLPQIMQEATNPCSITSFDNLNRIRTKIIHCSCISNPDMTSFRNATNSHIVVLIFKSSKLQSLELLGFTLCIKVYICNNISTIIPSFTDNSTFQHFLGTVKMVVKCINIFRKIVPCINCSYTHITTSFLHL